MSVNLWRSGTKLDQTDEQLAKAKQLAARMAAEGPPALRELATAIAETVDVQACLEVLLCGPTAPKTLAHTS